MQFRPSAGLGLAWFIPPCQMKTELSRIHSGAWLSQSGRVALANSFRFRTLGLDSQLLPGSCCDVVRLEAEFLLQLLERRRGPEGGHADDASRRADVTLPSEG